MAAASSTGTATTSTASAPGWSTPDSPLLITSVVLAGLLLLVTGWRLAARLLQSPKGAAPGAPRLAACFVPFRTASSRIGGGGGGGSGNTGGVRGLGFLVTAFVASVLYAGKAAAALEYSLVAWLNPQLRYVCVYGLLNAAQWLLFVLYERRLALLFRSRGRRLAAEAYCWTLRVLLLAYAGATVAVTYVFVAASSSNAAGGYTSNPSQGWYLRVLNYSLDMSIGCVVLAGTFHALVGMVGEHRRAIREAEAAASTVAAADISSPASAGPGSSELRTPRAHPAASLGELILRSDCVKFLVVAAIEAYKLANSSNASYSVGALQRGNTGLQHLIDTIKVVAMTASLFAPVALSRAESGSRRPSRTVWGGGAADRRPRSRSHSDASIWRKDEEPGYEVDTDGTDTENPGSPRPVYVGASA
ncbi:hypothetical protein HK405_015100 [Cladochytrium tenue]|nr:hypothetical protein HK405_015100 [Cladochytrium tenue]